MVLLSVKAGLRAGEIAKLTWPMVVDAQGRIGSHIGSARRKADRCARALARLVAQATLPD
jgi:6-phosphofructokinase